MSGVYLTVEETKCPPNDPNSILHPTEHGWPHITVVDTSKRGLLWVTLMHWGQSIFNQWFMCDFAIEQAQIDAQEDGQYAVLMLLEQKAAKKLQASQANLSKYGVCHPKPHVTHSIHASREAAEAALAAVQAQLPRRLFVRGYKL